MAQMLATVVNEQHNDWDAHLPHMEFSSNNSVSAATGLAPNEVHMSHLFHLPLTVSEHPYARGRQSLARDQLEYVGPAADRQRRSFVLVRERTPSLLSVSNAALLRYPAGSSNPRSTTPSVVGYGSITPPVLSGKGPKQALKLRFSNRNSRLTGPGHSRCQPSAPPLQKQRLTVVL